MPVELLILALELGALYALGSYAMRGLAGLGADSAPFGPGGKLAFYLLVMPGVVVHESAHYLAAKITLTPVGRFVPFAPKKDAEGRVTLGYVEHGARNPLTAAVIGLAPVILNPLALVGLSWLMLPARLTAELSALAGIAPAATSPTSIASAASPAEIPVALGQGALEFLASSPVAFFVWAYLAISLALGSCPSREDLVSVPAAAVVLFVVAWLYSSVYGLGFVSALVPVAAVAISVYSLPVLVAGVAALASLLIRASAR